MIKTEKELDEYLNKEYDIVLTTDELTDQYEVTGFQSPFCVVKRKSDIDYKVEEDLKLAKELSEAEPY